MPPAIAVAAGAAVLGAGAQIVAGNKSAKAITKGQDKSIAEQQRQYDTTRADYAPYRAAGTGALDMLSRAYGIGGQAPDMTAFQASPGYQFRYNEGLRAIDRGAAARGLLHSGGAVKAEQRFGEGLASSEFGDWWNRLAGVAGVGQQATAAVTQAGQNSANNISNAYTAQGNARASSYANTGSAINSGINNIVGAYLYNQGGGFGGGQNKPKPPTGGWWGG
jgi:hypothetical protein